LLPDTSWSRFGLNLARRPGTVAERVGSLGRELASIARGNSDRVPARADTRFSDPAWQGNPLLKRSMQAYMAADDTVEQLFADAELKLAGCRADSLCPRRCHGRDLAQQQSIDQSAGV